MSEDGRESVLAFRGPGEVLGELSAIDGQPRSAGVRAVDPVEALVIPTADFRAFLERSPRGGAVDPRPASSRACARPTASGRSSAPRTRSAASPRGWSSSPPTTGASSPAAASASTSRSRRRSWRAGSARRARASTRRCTRCAASAGSRPSGARSRCSTWTRAAPSGACGRATCRRSTRRCAARTPPTRPAADPRRSTRRPGTPRRTRRSRCTPRGRCRALDLVVVRLVRRRVDAVDRADLDARVVLGADAGLCDDVCHGFLGVGVQRGASPAF